jgi:pimeloyl-ACP methyl ester carboxylesterase
VERIAGYLARYYLSPAANMRMPGFKWGVPASGHWIIEENPEATVKLVREFLNSVN